MMQRNRTIKTIAGRALLLTTLLFNFAWSMDSPMIWTSSWNTNIRGTKAAVISGTCASMQNWFTNTYPTTQYQEFAIKSCHEAGDSFIAPYYIVKIHLEFKRTTFDGQGNITDVWESYNASGASSNGAACQPPLEYNAANNTCETSCPTGQTFSPDSRACSAKDQPQCESHTANPINFKNGVKKRHEIDWEGQGPYPLRFVRYYNSMGNLRREWSGYGPDPKVSLLASQTGNTNVLNGAAGSSGPKTVYSEAPAPLGQAQLAQAYPFDSPEDNTWDKTSGYIGHADRKWRHNYDYYLFIQKSDGSQIIAYRPDGTDIAFKNLQPQIAIAVRLSRLLATDPIAPNGYLYTTENLGKEYYDLQGRILKTINRDGFTHSYTYDAQNPRLLISVTDAFGATISFAYDAENRLTQMMTPGGQIYRYSYHPENNLYAAVIYPDDTPTYPDDNPKREYLYEDARFPDALTGINDNGVRYANVAYDNNGRAIMSELGGGMERVDIEYTDNDTRLLGNALGKQTRYEFVNINGSMLLSEIFGEASPNCAATTQRIVYDSLNRKKQSVARDGTITNYSYNTLNRLSTLTEAYGTPDARSTSYSYDSLGRKISESAPNQGSTNYTRDANGRIIEISRGYQKTRFTYTAQGLLQSVDGPRNNINDTLNYSYDTQGRLSGITDGKGNTTQITAYDSANRPLTVTDANGVSTDYSYHPRGWLASKTTEGATTQFQYDIVGNLMQITEANGDTTHYEYNSAHQLTAIQDAADNRIEYSRDLLGNITASLYRDAQGTIRYQQQRHYDELGRLRQTSGENGQSTDYDYDLSDNPIQATNALNQVTSYQYDRFNRLKQSTDALNGLTQYQYNQADWLTKVIDPKGHATLYYYNNDGNITSLNSPNTGTENWTYDLWGGQLTQYWGNGQYWYYSWDANNRLTYHKMGGAGSADDRYYTYDETANGNYGKNRLTKIQDGSGQTNYRYDAKGQITQLSHNIGPNLYTLSYQYDSTGRVTDIHYPGGAHLIYHYANHQLSKIEWQNGAQTSTLADNLQYLPFGPLSQLSYGNGLNLNRSFDQDYRLNNQTLSGLESKTYSYTLVDNLATVQDTQSPVENISYHYDALSRLSTAQNNNNYQYSYDPVGNRLSETLNSTSTNYNYKTTNQQLTQMGSTTVQHDSYGRITQKGSWTYVYNYYNHRLKEVKYQNQLKASYVYNALNQRTRKILPGNGETQYIYDLDDQLIAEANASGTLQRQYVYLNRQPLALIENGNIYYYHNDALGTPKKISNALQQIVWQAEHTPFGMATMTVASVENNLRFAGQYFDQETGLHYNYFRDYDPNTGRYLQSDPIGLDGGINTYGYANQNPIIFIDPLGLESHYYDPDAPLSPGSGAAHDLERAMQPIIDECNRIGEKLKDCMVVCGFEFAGGESASYLAVEIVSAFGNQAVKRIAGAAGALSTLYSGYGAYQCIRKCEK